MSPVSPQYVHRSGNVITISSLSSPFVVRHFLRALHQGQDRGYSDFAIDFRDVQGAFPNACAPLAGILEYYRSERGFEFESQNVPDFVAHTKTLSPLIYGLDQSTRSSPLNTVWKFATASEIHLLVDACLEEVSRAAVCEAGVIQGLEWCLNEVMDNVLQHASTTHGYMMAQIHSGSRHIAICIYDYGQGIYNSLRSSPHAPTNAVDAITVALEEGVTRDKEIGQGNGLWGLYNIVHSNSGQLNITSGPGFFGLHGSEIKTSPKVPYLSSSNNCTTVD